MNSKNTTRQQWLVFTLLIVLGVAARFWIETPNFKPLAAFALFGGFFFRKPSLAIGSLLAMLVLSDFRLGYYPLPLMISVYLALAISAGLGIAIGRRSNSRNENLAVEANRNALPTTASRRVTVRTAAWFAGASLVMSTSFFLLTNGAVWWMGSWYPPTLSGLLECYVAGCPFYRWTVLGDLFFTSVTVGAYVMIQRITDTPAVQCEQSIWHQKFWHPKFDS